MRKKTGQGRQCMSILEAILFGLVQGVTEFLTVSSSGHLTLLGRILGSDETAMLSFTTLLHAGTLVAVLLVLRQDILEILKDLLGMKLRLLIIASIPAALAAFLLGDWLDRLFGGGFLGYSFLITGLVLGLALLGKDKSEEEPEKEISYGVAAKTGLAQALAVVPGISRSGMTLTALFSCGIRRQKAIRFSFLMTVPAVLGALLLDIISMLKKGGGALESFGLVNILVGIAVSGLSGYFVMEFMLRRLTRRGFLICAIYVFILGGLVLFDQHVSQLVF